METEFKDTLLLKAMAAMGNEQLGELMKDILVTKARGSTNLTAAEIIRDMFLEGDLHKVPGKKQLEVGKPEAATGADAERMVREYSDFATQTPNGRTMNYEKLEAEFGEMKSAMKALADSMKTLTEITAEAAKATKPGAKGEKEGEDEEVEVSVNQGEDEEEEGKAKSLRAQATKTILSKAEDEEEEDEGINQANEGEEEEEEGKAKSLSDTSKVRFAKALIGGAEDALKKGIGKGLRREVENAVRKAHKLATMAVESKDKDTVKVAKSILSNVEEFVFLNDLSIKAKKKKDGHNQKTWPDKEGMDKSITDMQANLAGLMNVVENMSRARAGVPSMEALKADSPLVKGGNDYFEGKLKLIDEKALAGLINEQDQGAAEEMVGLMQAVVKGHVPEAVVRNTIRVASPQVRGIFPEWVEEMKG